MSTTTESDQSRGTRVVRLAAGESIDFDLDFCDLVPPSTAGVTELRLKGRIIGPDGRSIELVRLYVDLEMIEPPLRRAGVLRDPIPDLPDGERMLALKVHKRRLTVSRVKMASGATCYRVTPREGVETGDDERLLADYLWAIGHARNSVVPVLEADRLAIGASDVLAIARTLFHERRRGRPGRE
jgi:hypothetical protein